MFYNQFIRACNKKGVSPTTAVKSIGMSKSNVKDWREGRTPTPKTIKKLENYFEVDSLSVFENMPDNYEQLNGKVIINEQKKSSAEAEDEKTGANLSADDIQFDKEMLDLFHQLNRAGKSAAISMVLGITSNPQFVDKEIVKPLSTSQTA